MENQTIFAFDLGTGSIGSCVRKGKEILHLEVELLPQDYAAVKEARERRRQIRTRIAHKKREEWWKEQAKIAGIEVPETGYLDEKGNFIKPDPRISREFPEDGDNTIYNSALLRIALLQGKKLEGWQIFKAIWSAIQHRGYDENLPWKTGPKRNLQEGDEINNDEKENEEAVKRYKNELQKIFGDKQEFYYPCYYEAFKMGIWDPNEPTNLNKKISNNPNPARNKDGKVDLVIPRELIEKEIKDMLIQAGKQYPYFSQKLSYILYGPGESPYAAYTKKEYRKYLGKDWEWQGLLSQKTPRFDNRIISKCALIPRLNACKAKDELNQEVTFLMKLKNIRYFEINGGEEKSLTAEEIRKIFEKFKDKKKITSTQWKKYLKENLNAVPNPSQMQIEPPKIKGRSRFSRPALRIIKEIILSGKSPHILYEELTRQNTNTDPKKGLIKEDYLFLLKMPKEWEKFYIPDHRADEEKLNEQQRLEKIYEILNEINNPVVRHRLYLFYEKLKSLKKEFGEPDRIYLEFVRDCEEGFQGEKKRKEYIKIQKENQRKKDLAFKKACELGLKGGEAILKVQLYEEQGGIDVYDGKTIKETEIDNYEIDHIVPREMGGPDSYINKVLTSRQNNNDKGKRIPYEWFKNTGKLDSYLKIIESLKGLSDKKKELLTSANAVELVNKYTQLAETAYISKLSQKICYLFFGWQELTKGSTRKIFVSNGGLTAKMRRRYELDRLLHTGLTEQEYKQLEQTGELDKKNRVNPRHHALDALVISMTPEIKIDEKTKKDVFPDWFNKDFCAKALEQCFPKHIRYEKPKLAETIYGLRKINDGSDEKYVFVTRFGTGTKIEDYYDIKNAIKYVDSIFSPKIKKDFKEKLKTNPSEEDWKQFLDNYFAGGKPKKILLKASTEISKEEIDDFLNGRVKNFGEFIKGKMPGQYLKQKKESYGYIVYKNEKGKWIREPIYVFDSLYEKMKNIKSQHPESYYFRSDMLVEIKNDFTVKIKGQDIKINKGRYYLKTIGNNNFAKIENIDGSKVWNINIKYLMEDGLMRPILK